MRTARSSSRQGGGSASAHAGIDPPGVGLQTPQPDPLNFPLGCGPGDPPGQIPLNFPLECGPVDPPWPDPPQLPPWVWAWKPARHAGKPPAMHAGIPPPCEQNHRHV